MPARRLLLCLAAATALMPASIRAQGVRDSRAATLTVRLSSFAIEPELIRLRAGVPVDLQLVNESAGGHNFSAPGFFAASRFPNGAAPAAGVVEVPAGSRVEIVAVPVTPGTYRVECTHFLHALFGMTGRIIVEPAPG
ncbi:MAG TPA: cupredoxin domain-containing protein [Acetobacteraceae bacterium]|jgi:plastocyanin